MEIIATTLGVIIIYLLYLIYKVLQDLKDLQEKKNSTLGLELITRK
jgi:hypothetical protein